MLAANVQFHRTLRATALATSALGGAVAIGVACIADLPGDAAADAATDSATDAPAAVMPPGCGNGYIDLSLGEQCDPGPFAGDGGVVGCNSNCRVKCAGLVWPINNHCYELSSNSTSFDNEAEPRCSDLSSHVVTFASDLEFGAVAGWMQKVDAGTLWVGLTLVPGLTERQYDSVVAYEPGWAPDCSGCYARSTDPSVALPRVLDLGDDGGPPPDLPCIVAESDTARYASWFQSVCTAADNVHTLCEREPVGTQWSQCDAGAGVVCIDLVVTHATKRYEMQMQPPATADGAVQGCQALGGRLVVLQSRDEREQLWHQISLLPNPPTKFWIGLAQEADAGGGAAPWVWDDGTAADAADAYPPPWARLEPSVGVSASRAYLAFFEAQPDNTLARNGESQGPLPFVCEFPVAP
ncbi:MAG: C-type lectin domain-containing protein [Polyangiaceae bacterium]